jgi:hypothetical protein
MRGTCTKVRLQPYIGITTQEWTDTNAPVTYLQANQVSTMGASKKP